MSEKDKWVDGRLARPGVALLIGCACMMAYLVLGRHGGVSREPDGSAFSSPGGLTSAAPLGSPTPETAPADDGAMRVEPETPFPDAPRRGRPGGVSAGSESLELLTPVAISSLSAEEQMRAVSSFESQRQSWLAIRSGSARFETSVRTINNGQYVEQEGALPQTGLIQFLLEPLPRGKMGDLSPVKVKARMLNDCGWNFVKENVFDPTAEAREWAAYEYCPLQGDLVRVAREAFSTELLFFPFDFMAKTFRDATWHNRYTSETKEEFFADRGIPWRRSTAEEEARLFQGEPQYLFMASPGTSDAHYWFSAENGDLRRIDVFLPGNVVKSFQYEDYYRYQDHEERFPRKLTLTWAKNEGASATGWEFTMRLTNVALNIDIPAQDFLPPGEASSP